MESDECLFVRNSHVNCPGDKNNLKTLTEYRINNAIERSKERLDTLHLSINPANVYKSHPSCIATYTSSYHVKRHLDKLSKQDEHASLLTANKRSRRSEEQEFNWKDNCFFCGEPCLPKDPKNPNRWRQFYECHTSHRGIGNPTFKEEVLKICDERMDDMAHTVRIRLCDRRCSYDLHTADARYHEDCRKSFMSPRNVQYATTAHTSDEPTDAAYHKVVRIMEADASHNMWTSVEVHTLYTNEGGTILTRRKLVENLSNTFSDLIVLTSPGISSMLVFQKQASANLHLQKVDDDDDIVYVQKLAKKIIREIKQIPKKNDSYRKYISVESAKQDVSATLATFMSYLSPSKLSENSLPAILIGNIITSCIMNRYPTLLVDLGILVREQKLIDHLHAYGIVCSYAELRQVRISAAVHANKSQNNTLRHHSEGLVQVIADNFDCNISSMNGLMQTHSLAMLMVQTTETKMEDHEEFCRIRKVELKDAELKEIPIVQYDKPKKQDIPVNEVTRTVMPLKVLAQSVAVLQASKGFDFEFLKTMQSTENTPEYSGYNTRHARESGRTMKGPTTSIYTPLIDMKPADHTTMMTSMVEAQLRTEETCQKYTVFTADQQLYKIIVDITWAYPEKFKYFIPRLGGMHLLMSFVGCVGNLMSNTGLDEILKSAFGSVEKMLIGKNFPQNVRALRMVVEEILGENLASMESYDDLEQFLEMTSEKSRTSKLWVDNLIKPVLYMMLYVRAEREAEWTLHLYAVSKMIPYFFAAGHNQYARYGLYYLRSMEKLPSEILEKFLKGEHVTRHQRGYFNGIWSDMHIETTFMRHGKGPGGLIGITLKPKAVKIWANSLHICTQIIDNLEEMRNRESNQQQFHKEEMPARIMSDDADRVKLRHKIHTCVPPLDPEKHPIDLVNVESGIIIQNESVNVDKSVEIGTEQMQQFENNLPNSFNATIKKQVKTMVINKKSLKVGDVEVYNTEAMYARVMCLLSTGEIKLDDVMGYELSPVPTSLFKESGEMRQAKSKSDLKNKLKVEMSSRSIVQPEVIIVDGCAKLWTVEWPAHGTVEDLAHSVYKYTHYLLLSHDVYLVFDRYAEYSIKDTTRDSRGKDIAHRHFFTLTTPLPNKAIALSSTSNKIQLIDIITTYVCKQIADTNMPNTLIVTGSENVPTEVKQGITIRREDLKTSQEEADTIMVNQCFVAIDRGARCVKIISDDTDVFVLLLHFAVIEQSDCIILMENTSGNRQVINITETCRVHHKIIPSLLAAHALTGCDSVPQLFNIGKKKVVKVLEQQQCTLKALGNETANLNDVYTEATLFIASCYGLMGESDMSTMRYKMWKKKTLGKLTCTPKLCTLPPTTEVFQENVKRAHYQCSIWKNSLNQTVPNMDPTHFGWTKDCANHKLRPIMIPDGCAAAPDEILETIRCGCSNCARKNCSCAKVNVPCSMFCKCDKVTCLNPYSSEDTVSLDEGSDNDDEYYEA